MLNLGADCVYIHRYYVKTCAKPEKKAALALAICIGSAPERDDEQGVAHVIQHLAFTATEVRAAIPAKFHLPECNTAYRDSARVQSF